MATISGTSRPGYVWDSTDNVWYPIGTGVHTHDYIPTTLPDAKGDIITATADNTPARLAVGNNGESLVADSAATTGLRYQGSMAAGKNFWMNGGLAIWQRGTSFSTASAYTADRWFAYFGSGTWTMARTTTDIPTGFQYGMKATSSGATASVGFYQAMETANAIQLAGKTVTMSGYIQSSNSGTFTVDIGYSTNTDEPQSGTFTSIGGQGATSTTTSARFSVQFAIPSSAKSLRLNINTPSLASGATATITGMQVEIGSVATNFTLTGGTIQGELAACQRYYEKSYDQATVPGTASSEKGQIFAPSGNAGNGVQVCSIRYAVVKRNVPTITFYSYTGATAKLSDAGGTDLAANSAFTNNTAYGGNSGTRIYNGSGGTITAAFGGYEFHFVADSEL